MKSDRPHPSPFGELVLNTSKVSYDYPTRSTSSSVDLAKTGQQDAVKRVQSAKTANETSFLSNAKQREPVVVIPAARSQSANLSKPVHHVVGEQKVRLPAVVLNPTMSAAERAEYKVFDDNIVVNGHVPITHQHHAAQGLQLSLIHISEPTRPY